MTIWGALAETVLIIAGFVAGMWYGGRRIR